MRYFVGLLVVVGLIILIIVLIFTGGKPGPQPINLVGLADTGTQVRLVNEGQLTADTTRRSIEITVGRDSSELDVIQGYQGHVIKSHQIANNEASYDVFLRGLMLNGFNLGNNDPAMRDERGHCALGQRYLYEVLSPSGTVRQKYWSDTCGNGTFKGSAQLIQTLFENQIPDYNTLTYNVNLNV